MSGSAVPTAGGPTDTDLGPSRAKLSHVISRPDQVASPAALDGLAVALDRLVLTSDREVAMADRAVRAIRSFIIPRLSRESRPLTVVFAGPTGAGKSTLLNSVAGANLSATGPLRPTTTLPRVYAHAGPVAGHVVPDGIRTEVIQGRAPVLKSMTLVDSPDIDSTATEHRAVAETLIDNADVVVFVSSAMRYGDRVPWEVLRRARSRGAPVICVLNRIRANSEGVVHDYRRMLDAEGLGGDLVAIGEHHLAAGVGRVPSGSVRRLRRELVAQVERHRLDSETIVRRVVDATCSDARLIIEAARAEATVGGVTTMPPADETPVFIPTPVLADYAPGSIPAGRILEAASRSKLRAMWRSRRVVRDPDLVGIESTRLVESVVLGLTRLAGEAGASPTRADYAHVRTAITAWAVRPMDDLSGVRSRRAPLAALMIRVAAASGAMWPEQLLDIVAPRLDHQQTALTCRRHLMTVAESVVREIMPDRPPESPPVDLMGPVRTAERALGEVITTVAFANA